MFYVRATKLRGMKCVDLLFVLFLNLIVKFREKSIPIILLYLHVILTHYYSHSCDELTLSFTNFLDNNDYKRNSLSFKKTVTVPFMIHFHLWFVKDHDLCPSGFVASESVKIKEQGWLFWKKMIVPYCHDQAFLCQKALAHCSFTTTLVP